MSDVLTTTQIEDLARPIVGMVDAILAYYQDPEHERAFQAWFSERYGMTAPKGV